jgi:hypothetical protein
MMDVKPTLPVGAKRQINLDDIASTPVIEPTVELEAIDDGLQGEGEGLEESTKVSTVTTMTLSRRTRMISMTIKPLKK